MTLGARWAVVLFGCAILLIAIPGCESDQARLLKNQQHCDALYPLGTPRRDIRAKYGMPIEGWSAKSGMRKPLDLDGVVNAAERKTGRKASGCDAYLSFEPGSLPISFRVFMDYLVYDETDCIMWRCHAFHGD